MKIAKTSHILTPITDWSQLNSGQSIQAKTQYLLDNTITRCFGYHLLKLGQLSAQLKTNKCPIRHQISAAENRDNIEIQCDLHQLPFQNSSFDLSILMHELDFSSDPHQLLREIDRVLTLNGILIISGYNPYSLFGIHSLLTVPPTHKARLFSPNRVVDWLHLLGFEIQQKLHFDYISAHPQSPFVKLIESIGQRYLPFFCSVYFIVAKKRTTPITPIKSSFEFPPLINQRPITVKQSHSTDSTS